MIIVIIYSIKKEEPDEEPAKKIKVESSSIVKEQNTKMYKYRDFLKTLPKKELQQLLIKNKQEVPPGTENVSTLLGRWLNAKL